MFGRATSALKRCGDPKPCDHRRVAMPKETIPSIEKFMAKVQIQENGCWRFIGYVGSDGYGKYYSQKRRRTQNAHIVSYELHGGVIPPDHPQLDHTCHRPSECIGGNSCEHRRCVNPNHLEPVTREENYRRGAGPIIGLRVFGAQQRGKTHCPHGHEYIGENIVWNHGKRQCLECRRKRAREYQRKRYGFNPRVTKIPL